MPNQDREWIGYAELEAMKNLLGAEWGDEKACEKGARSSADGAENSCRYFGGVLRFVGKRGAISLKNEG